ncbi:MAG TPA: hypothetical protein PK912_06165 [Microthrixaceae bacterium]|nr:hypothetical protein [Microthrixaceae bacterium]
MTAHVAPECPRCYQQHYANHPCPPADGHDWRDCARCHWEAGAPDRAARRYAQAPRDVPELGDEFDMHGTNPDQYRDGWRREQPERYRRWEWSR